MATRIAMGFLVAASIAASFPVLAAKPEVAVEFEITVPQFTDNLPEREMAIRNLRNAFSNELQHQFVFARWLTETPAQPEMQLGRLVVRLEQDRRMQPSPSVFVRLWGARPNGPLKELGLPTMEIYSPGNLNWDTNSRADFETRVITKTMETISNDSFREKFVELFLGKLSLSSTIETKADERVIEIPVRWNEMLLSSDSVLVVRFNKQLPQGNLDGDMKLGRIVARVGGQTNAAGQPPEFPARLRGSLTEAKFDGGQIQLNQQNWNDQIPQMLTGAKADCFILEYIPKDELEADSDRLGL